MQSRVEQAEQWIRSRIQRRLWSPGTRVPSIRSLAGTLGFSPFTVAEAYARLVAAGLLIARRGAGFYVPTTAKRSASAGRMEPRGIDVKWLMRNMLASSGARGPGLGVLPPAWLDATTIGAAVRALGRQRAGAWLESGVALGFAPLRVLLQQRLAELDIAAAPDQILLTTGVTQALDLVLRSQLKPGDTVMLPDPYWFGAIGVTAARGLRLVAVPCTPQGIDLEALERVARSDRPRLLIVSSAAHNPTGLSTGAQDAARLLSLARRHEFLIFEDDVYADLCGPLPTRLASLDQLDRVIYASSFAKTLASNLRVGYLAARPDRLAQIADAKILGGFTTPELNERLVHKLLLETRFARRMAALRARLEESRATARTWLTTAGAEILGEPSQGMFLWVNMRVDTNDLAVSARAAGLLLAPGSLFSAEQKPSPWMRVNVTAHREDLLRIIGLAHALR